MSQKQADHLARLHAAQLQQAVDDKMESDAELLSWRADGWSYATIGARLGVSKARAHQLVVAAKRRELLRQ